jgi:hypothetical protein
VGETTVRCASASEASPVFVCLELFSLVPTSLLAQQEYQAFERTFPIVVAFGSPERPAI